MKELVAAFSDQLRKSLSIAEGFKAPAPKAKIENVLVTGLGGSGIGGTIVAEVVAQDCTVPILVNKDYHLPGYINQHSLVIVSSYSGNTEETLQALDIALKQNAQICCVTSGGKVLEIAQKNNLPNIVITGGKPPRSCLGYSATQVFAILQGYGLVKTNYLKEIENAAALLDAEEKNIFVEADKVASFLIGKMPVIYAADGFNGVATRFRQQINENSKMLCWHHIFPEMNHNELVGWAQDYNDCAVVMLRNKEDYSRTQKRMDLCKDIFTKQKASVAEIWSKGKTQLERSFYLIHLTDWVSCIIADKKGIDPVEVNVINYLKDSLSKV